MEWLQDPEWVQVSLLTGVWVFAGLINSKLFDIREELKRRD